MASPNPVNCPGCGVALNAAGLPPGKPFRCPKCMQVITLAAEPSRTAARPLAPTPPPAAPTSAGTWLIAAGILLVGAVAAVDIVVMVRGRGTQADIAQKKHPESLNSSSSATLQPGTTGGAENAAGWVKVEIKEGPCSALFPAQPKRNVSGGAPANPVRNIEYGLELADLPMVFMMSASQPTAQQRRLIAQNGDTAWHLQHSRGECVRAMSGKLVSERPITLAGLTGTEFQFDVAHEGKMERWRWRTYYSDGRFFQIVVMASRDSGRVDSPDAEKFFNSFKLDTAADTAQDSKDPRGGKPTEKPQPASGAVTFEGNRYQVFTDVISWHAAKERCEKLGGRLAVVTSEKQNQFLSKLVLDSSLKEAWLGATDETKEGTWVWVDGTAMSYKNWGQGQPNNAGGREHYLLLWAASNGHWSDQPANSTAHRPGHICEWSGAGPGKGPTSQVGGKGTDSAFQVNSVWVSDAPKRTLTVLERKGDKFRAKFSIGAVEREISGTVNDGKVAWLAKDVRAAAAAGPGGDNEGTIRGDTIDFVWRDIRGGSGKFTLRLRKEP